MIERLACVVQDYAWGHREAIAVLQGRAPTGEPEAELWMGAHPKAPSVLADGRSLDVAVADDPLHWLGDAVVERFGAWPFLCKILAAAEPLSIQAHPSAEQAAAGFAREDAAGVDRGAPERTYRDPNHKPELICALTSFEALCGFRDLGEVRQRVDGWADPVFDPLRHHLAASGDDESVLGETVAWLLSGGETVTAIADALGRPGSPDPVAASIAEHYPGDPGVVVSVLLNHLILAPGQAVFLGAGNLHAYLRGVGVELMANSDNVVRGGLTPKHVDLDELQRVVEFRPLTPDVQTASGADHRFRSGVDEFALTRLEVADGDEVPCSVVGPELVVVTDGRLTLVPADGPPLELAAGEVVAVPAATGSWRAKGAGIGWRATVNG